MLFARFYSHLPNSSGIRELWFIGVCIFLFPIAITIVARIEQINHKK